MRFLKKPWMILMIGTIVVVSVFLMKDTFTQASPLSKEEIHSQLAAIYDSDVEELTLRRNTYEATLFKNGAEYSVQANAESGKVLSLKKTKDAPVKEPSEVGIKPPKEEVVPPVQDEEQKTNQTNKADEEDKVDQADKEETEQKEEIKDKEPAEAEEEPDKKEEKPKEKATDKSPTKPKESEDPPKKEPTTLISKEEAAEIALAALPKGMTGEVDDIEFKESTDGGFYLVEIDIDTEDDSDGVNQVIYQIHAISGEVLTATWDD